MTETDLERKLQPCHCHIIIGIIQSLRWGGRERKRERGSVGYN